MTARLLDADIAQYVAAHYQLEGELTRLPGYCDLNLRLQTQAGQQYIVKVAGEGEAPVYLDLQNQAMNHLAKGGLPVPQVLTDTQGRTLGEIADSTGERFPIRVLTYLPGQFYADLPKGQGFPTLWQQLGEFMGRLDKGLSDFRHPGLNRYLDWDLAFGLEVCRDKLAALEGDRRKLVEGFLLQYQTQVKPFLSKLPAGPIHNDANDYNLLVNDLANPSQISGLIDFGDMCFSQLVNELAITCTYAMLDQRDPVAVIGTIAKGYHSQRALSEDELKALPYLICLRLCVSVCNSAHAIRQTPDNDYLLISARPVWQALEQFKQLDLAVIGFNLVAELLGIAQGGRSKASLLASRQSHFSRTLSLSYQEPLKIVRGRGAYLFDEQGRDYLDMVNNVCHVGHCHPKVVAAAQQQMAQLNTNTRYLHDNLVSYGEKLLGYFPDKLSVCFLVNSGSEANELAFRMARCASQSRELLVVDGAYHGNTNACIDASPYKFDGPGGEGAPAHVHKVMLPDPYRGSYAGYGIDTGQQYAADIQRVLADLNWQDKKPGAYICESVQGVAGQIVMPQGYLASVYEQVRAAGGICIADEVQIGFGRVGEAMWGFETQQVVPDIVTLGKPIGNGHPMAAVITSREVADAFVTGMEYFNTFGGNPVSCAIGQAVLEVIEEQQLQAHAKRTGDYMQAKLNDMANEFELIGDVRGLGLFIGVELVTDRDSKAPATAHTKTLIEHFKAQRILLSTEGPFNNILKIKPPMVFGLPEADRFLDTLRSGLKGLGQ
ncbi:aminotransferase class III-fold pyridoxal phosphate-dependent enzyme [Bowmanella pacifica]|uniref:Aminotransferase n=1 Tax=Bowmanella pacifica TaxID=502051 RepID=A0A917YVC6_9ALTE|nr:aminotransferase class III-fold pyridoxal phosphate-dependent enzyme [Bowmanella pacifica]GGO67702.1 aminotransferase [Bowmanella pacifica]